LLQLIAEADGNGRPGSWIPLLKIVFDGALHLAPSRGTEGGAYVM
jgi:hypothetical protein